MQLYSNDKESFTGNREAFLYENCLILGEYQTIIIFTIMFICQMICCFFGNCGTKKYLCKFKELRYGYYGKG